MGIVIVTGGAGYIGSHVCMALKEAGFTPVVVDHLGQGNREAIQWGPHILGDILDKPLLKNLFQKFSPVGVIHLASLINVRDSLLHPDKYYRTNLLGTLSLLEAMQEEKISCLIFSSSAAVYGQGKKTPIPENHPTEPLHPYGISKLMAERMLADFSQAYDLSYVSLRYFNAAGADLEGRIGEAHTPETHLIPSALLTLLKKDKPLPIYGEGTAIRDYIHVTDLADAHVRALLYLLNSSKQQLTLNLGTGQGHSLQEILEKITSLTGYSLETQTMPALSAEPAVLVADAQKAHLLLDWEARFSDLETILTTALAWHKKKLA